MEIKCRENSFCWWRKNDKNDVRAYCTKLPIGLNRLPLKIKHIGPTVNLEVLRAQLGSEERTNWKLEDLKLEHCGTPILPIFQLVTLQRIYFKYRLRLKLSALFNLHLGHFVNWTECGSGWRLYSSWWGKNCDWRTFFLFNMPNTSNSGFFIHNVYYTEIALWS